MASDKVGAGGKLAPPYRVLPAVAPAAPGYLLRRGRAAPRRLAPCSFNWLVDSASAAPSPQPICASHEPVIAARMPSSSSSTTRPSYAGEGSRSPPAWPPGALRLLPDMTRRVLFGAADIKQEGGAVVLLQPALQRGLIDDRHPGPFGKCATSAAWAPEAREEGSYCRCAGAPASGGSVQPCVPLRRVKRRTKTTDDYKNGIGSQKY